MKVGFIGIGYMGRHMARNIRAAGHELTVFDIQKQLTKFQEELFKVLGKVKLLN